MISLFCVHIVPLLSILHHFDLDSPLSIVSLRRVLVSILHFDLYSWSQSIVCTVFWVSVLHFDLDSWAVSILLPYLLVSILHFDLDSWCDLSILCISYLCCLFSATLKVWSGLVISRVYKVVSWLASTLYFDLYSWSPFIVWYTVSSVSILHLIWTRDMISLSILCPIVPLVFILHFDNYGPAISVYCVYVVSWCDCLFSRFTRTCNLSVYYCTCRVMIGVSFPLCQFYLCHLIVLPVKRSSLMNQFDLSAHTAFGDRVYYMQPTYSLVRMNWYDNKSHNARARALTHARTHTFRYSFSYFLEAHRSFDPHTLLTGYGSAIRQLLPNHSPYTPAKSVLSQIHSQQHPSPTLL